MQQINHFLKDSHDFHIIHNLQKNTIHWIGIVCVFHEHAKHQPILITISQIAGDGYRFILTHEIICRPTLLKCICDIYTQYHEKPILNLHKFHS